MLHIYLMGRGTLTFPFPIVQSVHEHGEYHVHHGKRIEEVQEVHEGQTHSVPRFSQVRFLPQICY